MGSDQSRSGAAIREDLQRGNTPLRIGPLQCRLEPTEEEQFVFDDRPANDSAELVALQAVPLRRKWITGVEDSVPDKFKQAAMKLVRARLRHDVHRAGGMISI